MSLNRQLWIALVLLMVVIFGATFLINGFTSSRYLERQLTLKNHDDAAALALSLSQQSLDATSLEIQLATLLDQGTYRRISLIAPDGKTVFERTRPNVTTDAPAWLIELFPVAPEPGQAQVTSGWSQLGTLSIESAERFAYAELWESAKRMFLALLGATLAAGLLGSAVLNRITRPLQAVVNQANAISERRFLHLDEPATKEFAQVTRAMNRMTERMQEMLDSSAQKLTLERDATDIDAITGFLHREPFLERVTACLETDDASSSGSLVLWRLDQLANANQEHGREALDEALRVIGRGLRALITDRPSWVLGRLGGADCALLAPTDQQPQELGQQVQARVREALQAFGLADVIRVPVACSDFEHNDNAVRLFTELDSALMMSRQGPDLPVTTADEAARRGLSRDEEKAKWKNRLETAIRANTLDLTLYPVVRGDGALIHNEGMLCLPFAGDTLRAAALLPWAYRLGLIPSIDRAVIGRGLELVAQQSEPLCVNLTLQALDDPEFLPWLSTQLENVGEASSRLFIDVTESAAFADPDALRRLQATVSPWNVRLGLDHVGFRVEDIGLLSELGIHYLKLDALFVRELGSKDTRRSLLSTYADIAKTLGIACIAEGISDQGELIRVFEAGATGATGPGVPRR